VSNIVDLLGRPFTPPEPRLPDPPEVQLREAIADAGLTPPDDVVIDGRIHRFSSDGRPRDDSGWYIAFPGTVVGGQFGCWRTGISHNFRADIGRDLSPAESMAMAQRMADAKRLRDAEQAKRRESAAETAQAIWDAATLADDAHPYLMAKGVSNAIGLRVTGDGRLVSPLYIGDDLVSLQFIGADGVKKYLPGGKAGGAVWKIHGDPARTYVCEGVATAISIFEATGATVIIAYSAGNLCAAANVAGPGAVVVADNDEAGIREAQKTGLRVVIPPHGDANDYAQAGGDLVALLEPPAAPTGYLVPADEFAGQPAPLRWIVKRWIQRDALHMVHGPSGSGKTFVVLDMILSAAAGLDSWFGSKVNPANVVYLAGEGHSGLRGRIAGWKLAHEVDSLNAWVSMAGDDLDQPDGLRRVYEAIAALPDRPDVIVVDTLHRFMSGDENTAKDTRVMLDACAVLQREFQAAVLLVHHTGVSEEAQHRARGSSAWRGALDIEISVIPATDERPLEIVQRKAKDTDLIKPVFGTLEPILLPWKDEDGEPVFTAYLKPEDAPMMTKKNRGEELASRRLEDAIIHSGDMLPDGHIYISAADWVAAYESGIGGKDGQKMSKETARKAVQRDKKSLLYAGKISEYSEGYILSQGQERDILAVIMKHNKNKGLSMGGT
jgi:putative DNA primase/helicase